MDVKVIVVGFLETNCYLIIKDNKCLIVDPGADDKKIINYIDKFKLIPVAILVTHYHSDHILAIPKLEGNYHIKTYNYDNLKPGNNTLFDFNFEVIRTPGHEEHSLCFYFKDFMMTGDLLFKNSIGRCDLEGGNFKKIMNSLDIIKKYPDDTIIYPGHGDKTTLKYEKDNNYYLRK